MKNDDDGFFIGVSHLLSINVSVGQRVGIGSTLGQIGNTGTCSGGRHAHVDGEGRGGFWPYRTVKRPWGPRAPSGVFVSI